MAIEKKKTKVKMNKAVYLGMSIIDISKTLMYEFQYAYIKPKYEDGTKLGYMDSDSFIIHIITEDFYKDIANNFKRWFDTSNYDENDERPLPIGKNKKEIDFLKDELRRKIMKEFAGLRAKTQAYLLDDDDDDDDDVCKNKKAKRTKNA